MSKWRILSSSMDDETSMTQDHRAGVAVSQPNILSHSPEKPGTIS